MYVRTYVGVQDARSYSMQGCMYVPKSISTWRSSARVSNNCMCSEDFIILVCLLMVVVLPMRKLFMFALVSLGFWVQARALRNAHRIHVVGSDVPDAMESFQDLAGDHQLPPYLLRNIEAAGYVQPTPIQMQAIPLMLQVCTHKCTYTHTHTHICMYTHTHARVCTYTHTHTTHPHTTHTHTHTHTHSMRSIQEIPLPTGWVRGGPHLPRAPP